MVSIKTQLIRAAAVGAVGAAATAGFMAPASAASASAGMHASLAAVNVAATGPNTKILAGPVRWSPTKLTGPPTKAGSTCSGTNNTFTITNKTSTTKTIQVNTGSGKMLLGKLGAGKKAAICGSGPKGAKAKFFIKGSTSVLTVTLS